MKKAVLFFATLLTAGAMMAQTIVSTQVEKRNVILEEYTGIRCQFCPDGHAMGNTIAADHPGHAWAINIHTGGYATGSGYETDWGATLAGQYNIGGYPYATVNRGTNGSSERSQWRQQANTICNQDSPVNVAATASIDPMTRQMTVNVEVYYTGSQSVSSNFLNVVLTQNNVIGQQSGAQSYNPDFVTEDGQYRHMHMLRDMITGQWGEELTGIAPETFIEKTYTYNIPAIIGGVPINNFDDLEVIVFVSETHKNILSGNKAEITMLPGAFVTGFNVQHSDCALEYQPIVSVRNTFEETVESWDFAYDGQTETFNIPVLPGQSQDFYLPTHEITVTTASVQHCTTTKTVSLSGIVKNGESIAVDGTVNSATFADFDIYSAEGPFTARVGIDVYGSEAGFALLDQSNCAALWSEGPWSNISPGNPQTIAQIPNARYYEYCFSPATAGLYIIRLTDNYGDGWYFTNDNNVSGFWLTNNAGSVISWPQGYSEGEEFSTKDFYLNVLNDGDGSHGVGIDDVANIRFEVYPNPTTDRLNIECGQTISRIEVLDVAGRTVMSQNGNVNSINTKALAEGVYMLRVMTEAGVSAQKFVKE